MTPKLDRILLLIIHVRVCVCVCVLSDGGSLSGQTTDVE